MRNSKGSKATKAATGSGGDKDQSAPRKGDTKPDIQCYNCEKMGN